MLATSLILADSNKGKSECVYRGEGVGMGVLEGIGVGSVALCAAPYCLLSTTLLVQYPLGKIVPILVGTASKVLEENAGRLHGFSTGWVPVKHNLMVQ